MMQRTLYERLIYTNAPYDQFESDADTWDYHYHKIMCGLEGTDEEKEAIIRKRILRYFGEFKLDAESYFSIRNDVDYTTIGLQILSTKLVMYGIDYMTIERAKNYFQGFITNIRRMDDSHFLIEFRNENECLAAINKCQRSSQIFQSPQEMFQNSQNGWIEMKPYHEFIFERKLMARHCTTLDRIDNICVSTKKSCTFAYNQAKRRFMKNLKDDLDNRQRNKIERGRGKFGNKFDNNQNFSNRQRSRSRQKNNFFSQNKPCQCQYRRQSRMEVCACACNKNRRFQSRSRSKSPASQKGYLKSEPKMVAEQKIKESDFMFHLYLKRRDQKKVDSNGSFNAKTLFRADPFLKHPTQQIGKTQKSGSSTNNDECDMEIIEPQNVVDNDMNPQSAVNNTQLQFQMFLEKLKLDDSKNEYSAFDLEDIEG